MEINTYTHTNTYTYTKVRIDIINDHFEMFLHCSGMSEGVVAKMLKAVENHDLCAIGIYIEDGGYRIAEVEFEVDWDLHQQMISTHGAYFNSELEGWKEGVAPEAYVSAKRLARLAKEMNKPIRSWIRGSETIRTDEVRYRALCKELGYSYDSSPEPWKTPPVQKARDIEELPEARVIRRMAE